MIGVTDLDWAPMVVTYSDKSPMSSRKAEDQQLLVSAAIGLETGPTRTALELP